MIVDVTGLKTALDHIRRNPELVQLELPAVVVAKIRDEMQDMCVVKYGPRPVPGTHPWAASDAQMWDEREALRKRSAVTLLGVPVIEKPAEF